VTKGVTTTGTTALPPVICFGPLAGTIGPLLNSLMAGPNNEFQLTIAPS
jgi:hypothetical protein